jgi:hypothetical protein
MVQAKIFNPRFWITFGLTVWFLTTLAIRFVGQWVFLPDSLWLNLLIFAVSVPAMLALMQMAYLATGVRGTDKFLGACCALAPGLLLDGLLYATHDVVLPNLSSAAAGLVASWLLWCYGWCLVSSFLRR